RLRRRDADRPLLDRLHGGRRRGAALLRLHGAVRLLDAAARSGREPADPARRLGPRRPLVVPADRLLARAPDGGRGREEGVRDQRDRRRHVRARALPADPAHRLAELRGRLLAVDSRQLGDQPDRARAARRRGRQVGPAAAAHVASGRDGGPDTGQRPDPRRDDGHRGRLPDRPHRLAVRAGAEGARARGRARRDHDRDGRTDRARTGRHQARDRLLDDVADRLHVPRGRARRLPERDVPPDDARLLQGAAVHGRRPRHPRPRGRAGHAQDGRPQPAAAVHVRLLRDRGALAVGHPAVLGLLLEGLDPRRRARPRLVRRAALGRRHGRHLPDRPLRLPDAVHRLLGRAVGVRARAPDRAQALQRGPALDDLDRGRPGGAGRDRRLPAVRRHLDADHELARPGRAAPGRGEWDAGGGLVGPRRPPRCGRHRRRLVHLRLAQGGRAADRLGAEPARAQVLLRRGLRLRVLPTGGLSGDRPHALGRAAARLRLGTRARAGRRPGRARHGPPADRARPHLRASDRRQPRRPHRRLAGGAPVTTALIFLPVAGALLVMVLPLRPFAVGATALLVALAEVALWIDTVARFDFSKPGLQLEQQQSWFSDLNVSYHVGFYGFSLWLVGLTSVVLAAAVGYAFWAGRERPRAYYSLMLLLTGALVGVFVAQDLLLFYVFWEAMLVPLYFLVGVWGGAGRLRATLLFVIYTMAGSLLMLAAIIALGLSQGTFDLVHSGTSSSDWIFLGFVAAFAVKAPLFPFHAWLPETYRESSPEVAAVLSGVVSKAAAYGFLRIAIAKFPGPVSDFRTPILVLAAVGLIYGSLLAFRAPDLRGVIAYSSLAQMGLITLGLFAVNGLGLTGAVLQMVNH